MVLEEIMRMSQCVAITLMPLALVGCNGDSEQSVPIFNLCEGDEDCSEVTPDCRAVDAMGRGNPVSICTSVCSLDGPPCYYPGGAGGGRYGPCLGVNEDGQLDSGADERLCFLDCEILGSTCLLGEGGDGTHTRAGRCEVLEYGSEGVVACVDVDE
jgi:hypothetical protein